MSEKKSADHYFELYDQAPVGYATLNQTGLIVEANGTAARLLGIPHAALLEQPLAKFILPEDRAVCHLHLARLADTGIAQTCEFRMLRPEVTPFWIRIEAVAALGPGGLPVNRIILSDITGQKEAEEALREASVFSTQMIHSAQEGIVVYGLDLRYQVWNPYMEELSGLKAGEVVGKYPLELFPFLRETRVIEMMEKALAGEAPTLPDFEYHHPHEGKAGWVTITCVPLRNMNGEIIGGIGTVRDISERKHMEKEILRARNLESLEILAGGFAQDFNNILTTILGKISLVRFGMAPQSMSYEILSEAEKASFQAKHLTQQLMVFAKGGSPVKKRVRIGDLILEDAGFAARGSKAKCEFDLDPGLAQVELDPGQFRHVINHLVLNAIQAMPDGGVISIRTQTRDLLEGNSLSLQPGSYVQIQMRDSGFGIPDEILDKVFDPFFSTKIAGSGLGLASCFSIMKKHDGHIGVASELGKGTTFSLYFPIAGSVDRATPMDRQDVKKGRKRVLVMDDEPVLRKYSAALLSALGYAVETVVSGEVAVARYGETWGTADAFDAVILDLMIPGGKGGQETIGELLKINPDVLAIVSSGYPNDPVMAYYKDYGFSSMLPKPYSAQELENVLQRVLAPED